MTDSATAAVEQKNGDHTGLGIFTRSWSSIRNRIAVYFLLAGSTILVLGLILTNMFGMQTIRQTIGENFQELASMAAHRTEATIEAEYRHLKNLSRNPQTVSALAMAQAFYAHTSTQWTDKFISVRERAWQAGFSETEDEVLKSDLAQYLTSIVSFRKDAIVGISIVDMRGALLAASSRPLQFDMRRSLWWSNVISNKGLYISEILDRGSVFPSSEKVIEFALPIRKNQESVGVIYMAMKSTVVSAIFDEIQIGTTGHAMLVDSSGMLLVCKVMAPGEHLLDPELTHSLTSSESGWQVVKDDGHGGGDSIIGFAPVHLSEKIGAVFEDRKQWFTYVRQDPEETYAGLGDLLKQVGWLGTLLVVLLGSIGLYTGKRIESPIRKLQRGARLIGSGNLHHRIEVNSKDEIGDLASEFNQMADNILLTQEQLNHFADAVIHAGDSIVMTNLDASIFYVNPAFEELTGFSADEVIGETPRKWKSDLNSPETYQEMWDTVMQGDVWTGELTNRKKNKELYTAQMTVSPVMNEHGEIISLLGVQRDVTEKRTMEKELQRHHDELELLVEERAQEIKQAKDELEGILKSANDVIITLDSDGRFKYLNDRIKSWGYKAHELIGKPFNSILAEHDEYCPQSCGKNCELAVSDHWLIESKIKEFCIRTKDHSLINVMVSSSTLEGGDTLVIARDMTEVKSLQRRIVKDEQVRLIGEMATMVAHDFRNPLSTIKMNLQILSRRKTVNREEKEHFDLALDEVGTLEHLLSSMLDYARPSHLKLKQCNLQDTLESVLKRIKHEFDKADVQINLNFQASSPVVECDDEKIESVWRNIFINAIQAMPDGGVLNISTENAWHRGTPEIVIRISDNGCGMSDNVKARLFDPFFTMRSGGTGLGLAIVKKIIEGHQGSIEVVSKANQGTEFLIVLPLSAELESVLDEG